MNEFSILTYMLSQRGEHIGATEEQLMDKLNLEDKGGMPYLHELLDSYAEHLSLLGLKLARNHLENTWFITFDEELHAIGKVNPFHGRTRLASTLVAILVAMICDGDSPRMSRVKEIRRKKDISMDIKELTDLGLISVDGDEIKLRGKVGYYINLLEFMDQFETFLREKY